MEKLTWLHMDLLNAYVRRTNNYTLPEHLIYWFKTHKDADILIKEAQEYLNKIKDHRS